VDGAIVVVLAASTLWHVWIREDVSGPFWLRLLLPLLLDLPLLWRRRTPLPALAAVCVGVVMQALLGSQAAQGFELVGPVAVALYSTAAYGDGREAVAGLVLLLSAGAVNDVRSPDAGSTAQIWANAFWSLFQIAIWLGGRFARSQRERGVLVARTATLEKTAWEAASEERARIARELHDIVSHNLSVVVTQAAGARALAEHGANAPDSLERIEQSGRSALTEMRRLLGVLRDDGEGAQLEPQPGVAQLSRLVETLRASGLEVELRIDADCADLPPALDLSVYRIVQESLTNVLKHACVDRATVTVSRSVGGVTIEVLDDGAGSTGFTEGGHGLAGMRERVTLFGGRLAAGPLPEGGFRVRAELPVGVV
jgi:signal transduction histidine kinase